MPGDTEMVEVPGVLEAVHTLIVMLLPNQLHDSILAEAAQLAGGVKKVAPKHMVTVWRRLGRPRESLIRSHLALGRMEGRRLVTDEQISKYFHSVWDEAERDKRELS